MTNIEDLVQTHRYPITDPDGAGARLIEHCLQQLNESAICCLPNFLQPDALRDMQTEALSRAGDAHWIERNRSAYSWLDPAQFPEGHAVRTPTSHRYGTITRDRFAETGSLLNLFKSDVLTDFIRRCMGTHSLYRVECPHLSVNVKLMDSGACLGWHFDTNDGAVSLLLQAAQAGGNYEYIPYIRSSENENYEQVSDCLAGESAGSVMRPTLRPGTLCLFKGNRSLHRVTQVAQGDPDRLIALFSYDEQPGRRFSDRTVATVLGKLPQL
jgi:hypothetical protein